MTGVHRPVSAGRAGVSSRGQASRPQPTGFSTLAVRVPIYHAARRVNRNRGVRRPARLSGPGSAETWRRTRPRARRQARGRPPPPRAVGDPARGERDEGGLVAGPRGPPGGVRNGASVSTSRRPAGTSVRDLGGRLLAARGTRAPRTRPRGPSRAPRGRSRRARRSCGSRPAAAPRTPARAAVAVEPGPSQLLDERVLGVPRARPSSGSGGSRACRSRARARDCGAGCRAGRARARTSGPSRARSRRSRRPARRVPRPRSPLSRRPSTLAASWGWTPTAASSHGRRATSSRARADEALVPAGHQQPLDAREPRAAEDERRRRRRTGRR